MRDLKSAGKGSERGQKFPALFVDRFHTLFSVILTSTLIAKVFFKFHGPHCLREALVLPVTPPLFAKMAQMGLPAARSLSVAESATHNEIGAEEAGRLAEVLGESPAVNLNYDAVGAEGAGRCVGAGGLQGARASELEPQWD